MNSSKLLRELSLWYCLSKLYHIAITATEDYQSQGFLSLSGPDFRIQIAVTASVMCAARNAWLKQCCHSNSNCFIILIHSGSVTRSWNNFCLNRGSSWLRRIIHRSGWILSWGSFGICGMKSDSHSILSSADNGTRWSNDMGTAISRTCFCRSATSSLTNCRSSSQVF